MVATEMLTQTQASMPVSLPLPVAVALAVIAAILLAALLSVFPLPSRRERGVLSRLTWAAREETAHLNRNATLWERGFDLRDEGPPASERRAR